MDEPLDSEHHVVCDRAFSFLDLDEFRFSIINHIYLEPDIMAHLDVCELCRRRLAALAPDEGEMKEYYKQFKEITEPAPQEVLVQTKNALVRAARPGPILPRNNK
jgi:hypothetical protein